MNYTKAEVFKLFIEMLNAYRKENKYAFWVNRSSKTFSKKAIYFETNHGYVLTGNRYRLVFHKSEDHNGAQALPAEMEIELVEARESDVGTLSYETAILSDVLGRLQKELKLRGAVVESN